MDGDGTETTFSYNPDGIRIAKQESGITTAFSVDRNRDYAQVLLEDDGSAVVAYRYGDDLLSQESSSGFRFYHYDGLGSTRLLTDGTGVSSDSYDYEAFGALLNAEGDSENRYLFTGEQFDSSLDQYYLRARYYDQGVGRFTQLDTWEGWDVQPITLHKYLYVANDPILLIDPSGNIYLSSQMLTNSIRSSLATIQHRSFLRIAKNELNGKGLIWDGACFVVEDIATDVALQTATSGLYFFIDTSAKFFDLPYVGQSIDVDNRIQQHVSKGRTKAERVFMTIPIVSDKGTVKEALDIAEQWALQLVKDTVGDPTWNSVANMRNVIAENSKNPKRQTRIQLSSATLPCAA